MRISDRTIDGDQGDVHLLQCGPDGLQGYGDAVNQYRMHFKPKGRGNWAERSLLIRATAAPNRGDVMSMTAPDRLRPGKMVTLMMRVTRAEVMP